MCCAAQSFYKYRVRPRQWCGGVAVGFATCLEIAMNGQNCPPERGDSAALRALRKSPCVCRVTSFPSSRKILARLKLFRTGSCCAPACCGSKERDPFHGC